MEFIGTRVFFANRDAPEQVLVNRGGARSSKTHSISQLLIERLNNGKGRVIGICRKTMPALRMTAYRQVIELLKEYGRYMPQYHNKSENVYEWQGNRMHFFSVDDPEKVKSTEFTDLWLEEATEFTYADYITLKLRLSGQAKDGMRNKMFLSFNPDDADHWIASKVVGTPDVKEIISTYQDNLRNLSPDYIKILEQLKGEDANYWQVYGLGEWGKRQGMIYTNWDVIKDIPEGEKIYGLDFGFNNPTSLVEITICDNEIFLKELLYETGLTNEDLIGKLEQFGINHSAEIYADTAEPDRIEEISRAGFNVFSSDKSVRDGIDFCKRLKLHVQEGSVNLLKEIKHYAWKQDKRGEWLDEPVKFLDHLMDGMRYALFTHMKSRDLPIFGFHIN